MALKAENISKQYFRATGASNHFWAIHPTDLLLPNGSLTVLVGRSGSGKTTLLNIFAGLLSPTKGKVFLDDIDLYSLPDEELSAVRRSKIGVIPQGRAVLDALTVMENILLPNILNEKSITKQRKQRSESKNAATRAVELLEWFGIENLRNAMPRELSGGELRRVSIVRAMAQQPSIILADEPTGDLDDENTKIVLAVLRDIANEGTTVLLSTHETDALPYADTILRLDNGALFPLSKS